MPKGRGGPFHRQKLPYGPARRRAAKLSGRSAAGVCRRRGPRRGGRHTYGIASKTLLHRLRVVSDADVNLSAKRTACTRFGGVIAEGLVSRQRILRFVVTTRAIFRLS